MLWAPGLDTGGISGLGTQTGKVPSLDPLPVLLLVHPRTLLAFWVAEAHCGDLLVRQHPQVFLPWAALNPFSTQPVLVLGIAWTQVEDLVLGLVEVMRQTA